MLTNGITNPTLGFGNGQNVKTIGSPIATPQVITVANLALNAQTPIAIIPAGFTVVGIAGTVSDMDTGATLTFGIGDAAVPGRLLTGQTVGQTGGALGAIAATGLTWRPIVDTPILLTVTSAPTGAVAGTISFVISGVGD